MSSVSYSHEVYSQQRATTAYQNEDSDWTESAQVDAGRHHYLPTEDEVDSAEVMRYIRAGNLKLVVPMHEQHPVSRPMLQTLVNLCHVNPRDILIVDDRSHISATEDVRTFGVPCINKASVLECLNWEELDKILHRGEHRLCGKGMAVLAGYLAYYAQAQKSGKTPTWLVQHDSEIRSYRDYRGLQYLAAGILRDKDCGYVKMSKTGRGNERCMQVRSLYEHLAFMPSLAQHARERAQQLFLPMVKHRWMLTGEFGLRWNLAMARPFSSHLLEETLTSAYCEDYFSSSAGANLHTVQVANPYPRDDGRNPEHKEAKMQGQINRFLLTLLEFGPVHTWGLEDIEKINGMFLSRPVRMARILEAEEGANDPVKIEQFRDDRILPSVKTMVEEGLVNLDKLLQIV